MLVLSMTMFITPLFIKSWISPIQCLSGNNRSNKRDIIRKDLGIKSLKLRCWFRRPCHFYRMLNENSASYLFDSIPNLNRVHEPRHINYTPAIHVRHNFSFFPSTSEWNKFDWKTRNSVILWIFKNNLLNFIRLYANSIFDIHNPFGIKILTRLYLGLSHFYDDKFRHCFQGNLNPVCDCGNDTETITQFFLHCLSLHFPRKTILNNVRKINEDFIS